MKKILIVLLLLLMNLTSSISVKAQSTEVIQLLLNVEKLAQLKQILKDLKKSYEILHGGYTTIKDLSQGNFNIHDAFLNALWEVSPEVKKYYKVAKIAEYQIKLMKACRSSMPTGSNNLFKAAELNYIEQVYENLIKESLRNLDELLNVVTAKKLRMSDDERMKAIDGIFNEMEEKLVFVRNFNNQTALLAGSRKKELKETKQVRDLYNLK